MKAIENAEFLNATLVKDELKNLDGARVFYCRLRFDKNHRYEEGDLVNAI